MLKRIKFFAFVALLLTAMGLNAQVTTSSMSGVITDGNNEALIGATVQAVHVPSGTKYNAVSNLDGHFTIQGMRTGGPYRVNITYVGYTPQQYDGISLQLGNTYTLNAKLDAGSQMLNEIVVSGKGRAPQAGAAHNFSVASIEGAPSIDRNIYDVVKNMPLANQSKIGGISFAGSNNRYNSFQVDGTVTNDVFGLSSSGTNGGQASANPISMDAIQEIQVVVAPFDVRQSGFTGGGINAITKQGTNDFHATLFGYYNNQSFYGKYDASNDYVKSPLTKQHYYTVGGNISGPIVKDKLFFFVNLENHNESYPSSYYAGVTNTYLGTATAQKIADQYKALTGIQESFGRRDVKRNSFDILARVDWNISQNHKLALRYQHLDAYDDKYGVGYTTYYFNNSTYRFNNLTNSFVAELNSNFGSSLYNELRASYTRVRDCRDVPYQGPTFYIRNVASEDGSRSNINVNIGTEYSSGANSLDQDIYLVEDNLSWYKGAHTITFGTHNEFFFLKNLFMQYNNGEWMYNSLDAFFNNQPSAFYFRCADPTLSGGNLRYAPETQAAQLGFYVQDKYDYSRNLQLTYGLRVDVPFLMNKPTANPDFNTYADKNGLGVHVGETPSAKVMLSPRFGFRIYANDSHNTLFRGGLGHFTGRVPFVWISNMYNNTGMETKGTTINNAADIPAVTNNPQDLVSKLTTGKATPLDIATVDKKFKYPQVLRANLALEQRLPYDWKFTLEALYSKTLNNVWFSNLALTQSSNIYAVPGATASAAPYYSVDKSYNSIINLENTNRGFTYSFSGTIERNFDFGLDFLASYTFGHSKSVTDGTSSVAYSNWKYNYAVDSNNPTLSYSSFDQPHRVLVTLGYTTPKYANGFLQTNIAVTYNGYTGQRYSLTMSENTDFNGDGYRGNSLLYIPTKEELGNMIFTDVTAKQDGATVVTKTAQQQRDLFEQFIEGDSYAKNHRGQYADRNSNMAPWENRIDVHFAQTFFVLKNRGSKIVFTADILNFANLLNKKWGANYGNTYSVTPLTVVGTQKQADGSLAAQYQWNGYTEPTKANIASRWHAQVGLKLVF